MSKKWISLLLIVASADGLVPSLAEEDETSRRITSPSSPGGPAQSGPDPAATPTPEEKKQPVYELDGSTRSP